MFGKSTAFTPGMMVVCVDADQAPFLTKDAIYSINAVSHQGALIKVDDAEGMYAAVRFKMVMPVSNTQMEFPRAKTGN